MKQNKNLKALIVILAAILMPFAAIILNTQSVFAAAPRCYQSLVAPSGVGGCGHWPVTTGGYPVANKCYILQLANGGGGFVYQPASCTSGVFATGGNKGGGNKTGNNSSNNSNGGGNSSTPVSVAELADRKGERSCLLRASDSPTSCRIFNRWLFPAIDFLGIGVGILVTIMIVVGGIQYSASRGDPNAVAAARRKIANAVFALVAYGFFWSFIQWLVPGGIF